MIVTCQNCDAHFSLNDGLVKKTGSKVRCSKCKHVFVIYPDLPPELEMLSTDAGSESPLSPQEPRLGTVVPAPEGQPRLGDTLDGEAIPGGDLDLSEIEKMLSTDGQGESDDWAVAGKPDIKAAKEKPSSVKSPAAPASALDLSEIEKFFAMDQGFDDADRLLESEPEDLTFDLTESAVRTKETQKEFGDFNIADIEKMLEVEMVESETDETGGLLFKPNAPLSPASSGDEKAEDAEEPFDFSDIDEMMETDAAVRADADAGDEENGLTLEMDNDFKSDVPASLPESFAAIEELDFSDLEGMMKDDDPPAGDALVGDAEEELTLALDSDDRFEAPSAVTKSPETSDEVSLELDIADIAPRSSADADDLELRFSEADAEDQVAADSTVGTDSGQPMETENLDLEFNDEQLDEALAATEETAEHAASAAEEAEDEDEETEAAVAAASDIQPAEAKRSRKPLAIVLALVLLAGAAVCGYLFFGDNVIEFLNKKGIELPFLTPPKKPTIPDAGNLKITTIDIDSRFVENSVAGRLFVISGKARNGYADSRSLIRITGKLYSKGKQLVNTETVYCGNVLTSPELSTLTLDDMKNRLGNRQGVNDANVNIKPGEDRPFMVVFSKLPENLEEFTLEVAGSGPAAQSPQK